MIGRGRFRSAVWALLSGAATLPLMVGCQDVRFRDAQASRKARIEAQISRHEAREALRPAHIQWLDEISHLMRARRAMRLDDTLVSLRDRMQGDRDGWRKKADAAAACCRAVRRGRPERIPDTWALMAY